MADVRIRFSAHALTQMYARGVSEAEVREVLESGEVIEEHPDSVPCPTRLMVGRVDRRALHVVAAFPAPGIIVVVTVYEPDPTRWKPGFRQRR